MRILTILLFSIVLAACSGPKDTPLPRDLDKMDTIKPAMEKLTAEDRDLAAGYIMRHTIGTAMNGLFGVKADPIPDGMTLGKAIDEQRKFIADRAIEEAKQQALADKLKAEREAAMTKMREAVTVTLVSKRQNTERGYSGMVIDERISVIVGYKNNTDKDVAGIKGSLVINDIFGAKLSAFNISNDDTIKAGSSATWTGGRSTRFSMNNHQDEKFAALEEGKYKAIWEPEMIVFTNGERMDVSGLHAPAKPDAAQISTPSVSTETRDISSASDLARSKGCFVCHDISKKVVGPAYKDVSKRYAGQTDAVARLTQKVMNGGSGSWGVMPMPAANPSLTDAEAKALVQWILTL
jgi:cytochrome c551/c552